MYIATAAFPRLGEKIYNLSARLNSLPDSIVDRYFIVKVLPGEPLKVARGALEHVEKTDGRISVFHNIEGRYGVQDDIRKLTDAISFWVDQFHSAIDVLEKSPDNKAIIAFPWEIFILKRLTPDAATEVMNEYYSLAGNPAVWMNRTMVVYNSAFTSKNKSNWIEPVISISPIDKYLRDIIVVEGIENIRNSYNDPRVTMKIQNDSDNPLLVYDSVIQLINTYVIGV